MTGAASDAGASRPALLTVADLRARFAALPRDEREAWRALAPAWRLELDADADPCVAARASGVHCFRSASSTLALIRQLDRPGILTLRDENDRPVYALLTALGEDSATLRIGPKSETFGLISLASVWRGDFATFWRAPPGWAGRPVDAGSGATATWLGQRLAELERRPAPTGEADWRARLAAFQLARGLRPDGLAGPTTFMQLNRAIDVDEPRLLGGDRPTGADGGRPSGASSPASGASDDRARRTPTDARSSRKPEWPSA